MIKAKHFLRQGGIGDECIFRLQIRDLEPGNAFKLAAVRQEKHLIGDGEHFALHLRQRIAVIHRTAADGNRVRAEERLVHAQLFQGVEGQLPP